MAVSPKKNRGDLAGLFRRCSRSGFSGDNYRRIMFTGVKFHIINGRKQEMDGRNLGVVVIWGDAPPWIGFG